MSSIIKTTLIAAALTVVVIMQGCATKNYGRQGNVTSFEESSLTCREIDLELAKVNGFIQHVDSESQFDGRSVLSFLGDFGIGNLMEKDSALKSANDRSAKLQALRAQRCTTAAAQQPSAAVIQTAAVPAASKPFGEMSYEVEKLARQSGCQPAASAALIAKTTGVETYQVSCQDGQQALVKCEVRQCRMMN